jgi:hypothetical protein
MLREALPISIACLLAPGAQAAGGHHSIDDAAILDPGQCQIETWFERAQGGAARVGHLGPACRVGALELGLNFDAIRVSDGPGVDVGGVQAKWARSVSDGIAIGAVVAAAWQDRSPHHIGSTIVIPLTWQATDAVQLHLNVGRDFVHAAPDAGRGGIAVEWSASPTWSLVAERFRELRTDRWRLAARVSLSACVSVDVSRAQGLGSTPSSWTLGLNGVFDR